MVYMGKSEVPKNNVCERIESGMMVDFSKEILLANFGRETPKQGRGFIGLSGKRHRMEGTKWKSINIWNEAWLLGHGHGKITCQNININFIIVVDLINSEQNIWRSKVLRKLFDEEQANKIHTILIAGVDIKDIRDWKGDNTRVHSAKRGCKWLFKEDTTQMQNEVTLQLTMLQNFYTRLWNLQIASKIKITMWKGSMPLPVPRPKLEIMVSKSICQYGRRTMQLPRNIFMGSMAPKK
ncbi:hypothetical protein J1N35_044159 [Gossypium stocksii]|uniref:Uncharacterized protein n=1 Tax=Gossypium stocksii TaxID=47602 RepID=A0A9D3ZFR3_9ROSI|nr:hypothetical protein J1N35_044159 [Gossypium stocksii]